MDGGTTGVPETSAKTCWDKMVWVTYCENVEQDNSQSYTFCIVIIILPPRNCHLFKQMMEGKMEQQTNVHSCIVRHHVYAAHVA